MKKFRRDCKGAVTVFVTLLLIPAVLISGTAVDVARIYTARSAVQNANQLAANSTLASYNALLKDLYGVYGFMKNDDSLAGMISEYINIAVFGHGSPSGAGTFKSFYGSGGVTAESSFEPTQTLNEIPVLRRQILEYMKFRGPVYLVEQLLNKLVGLENLKDDAEIIEKKQEIDQEIAELFNLYRKLYYAILKADRCSAAITANIDGESVSGIGGSPFSQLTSNFTYIKNQLSELDKIQKDWEKAKGNLADVPEDKKDDDAATKKANAAARKEYGDEMKDLEKKYATALSNIKSRAATIKNNAEGSITAANKFKDRFELVYGLAAKIDSQKESLKQKLDELESKLNKGECSDELRAALTEEKDNEGKTTIERYRSILGWEVTPLAKSYRDSGLKFIESSIKMLGDMRYRVFGTAVTDANSLTLAQLDNLAAVPGFKIDDDPHKAAYFAEFTEINWVLPRRPPGRVSEKAAFYPFADEESSEEHKKFFEDLKKMVEGQKGSDFVDLAGDGSKKPSGGKDTEEAQRESIDELENKEFDDEEVLSGAKYIKTDKIPRPDKGDAAGVGSILELISNPLGVLKSMSDYALILTYDIAMFSCYTTTKPESIGKKSDEIDYKKSLNGVEISPKVNYFYQSEMEYIFNGSHTASDNLNIVRNLIFAVRMIANYIAVFRIKEITTIVNTIRSIPLPFGLSFVLSELARAGFAVAETAMDVSRIRKGYKVTFFKNKETWMCVPSKSFKDPEKDDKLGISYENYLLIFFLGKALISGGPDEAADDLVWRTGDLIEWNIVNYETGAKAREGYMELVLLNKLRFSMANAATGVDITTTVEMNMLFLSMPFAQKHTGGRFNAPLPITMTDKRGY